MCTFKLQLNFQISFAAELGQIFGIFLSVSKREKERGITDYYLDVKRIKAPKVDQDDDICPEVPEHFGDHPE